MKLYVASASPYVRKVLITVIEAGLDGEVERIIPADNVWIGAGDADVSMLNPIGKVPTLIARQGYVLTDSTLICEYLTALAPDHALLPSSGDDRWQVLARQALAHGVMDSAIIKTLETQVRPDEFSWSEWVARQELKIARTLDSFEGMMAAADRTRLRSQDVNLATITLGSALGYLSQRLSDDSWQVGRPRLSDWYAEFGKRPSMTSTAPPPLPPARLDPRKG